MKLENYERMFNSALETSGSTSNYGRGLDHGCLMGIRFVALWDDELSAEELKAVDELLEKKLTILRDKERRLKNESKSV